MSQDNMPDPEKPALALKPEEAHRFLSEISTGLCLATVLIATAHHGARMELRREPDDETDAERADRLKTALKTIEAILTKAGKMNAKNGHEIDATIRGMSGAFEKIGVDLPDAPPNPLEKVKDATDGEEIDAAASAWLKKENELAAAIICRADNPEARDLAERAGIDPDAPGIQSFSVPYDDKPKPKPKASPPTWGGRNGTKWKPDGTRDDGATPNN